jgi:hypothetical protein
MNEERRAQDEQSSETGELADGDNLVEAGQSREDQQRSLAEAMARGMNAAEWASRHAVPRATAYRWANERHVKATMREARRRALEELLGLTAEDHLWAIDGMKELATKASSEEVRLASYKSFKLDVFKLIQYAQVHDQMKTIEDKILGSPKSIM